MKIRRDGDAVGIGWHLMLVSLEHQHLITQTFVCSSEDITAWWLGFSERTMLLLNRVDDI